MREGRDRVLEPSGRRLAEHSPHRAEILRRHREAVAAGLPGYTDPATGLFVMTAAHHLDRGVCCRNGCRHCPWAP